MNKECKVIFKNPKMVKNISEETIKKNTYYCPNCGIKVVDLNCIKGKYCSRKCASEYRKKSGWSPSKEAREKISKTSRGRKHSNETKNKTRILDVEDTKEWLEKNYFDEGLTIKECAKKLGCSPTTVSRYLKGFGLVGKRSNRESQLLNSKNNGLYCDRDWFYQKYIVEKKSTAEIAGMCNAGRTTIKRWLKKHGIEARDNSESHKGIKRTKESRRKQAETVTGSGNHFYGKIHTAETIQKIMDKKMYHPYQGGRVKWYKHIRSDGKRLKLQGTWELVTARYFDESNIRYRVHGEFGGFSYMTKRGIRMYFPDFYLPKKDIYVEVKGFLDEKMENKMNAVIDKYSITIEVWTEDVLREKGILTDWHFSMVSGGYFEKFLV